MRLNKRTTLSAIIIIITIIVALIGFWASDYFGFFQGDDLERGNKVIVNQEEFASWQEKHEDSEVDISVETVAEGLTIPWSIVFTDEDRILFTERIGNIKVIEDGELNEQALINFSEISTNAEEGLMGLAVDPDYEENSFVYACMAYPDGDNLQVKVERLIDRQVTIERDEIILDGIPAARFHAGCRLAFGPDEMLYVTTGDATNGELAQQKDSLAGKILRINKDGSIPEDNPFAESPVFSLGHRNPQGIAWHPTNGELYASEHGPSLFDGPAGGDEINWIKAGENYGWPIVSHEQSEEGLVDPVLLFTPAEAPASGSFYEGNAIPQYENNFFFGALRGEGIVRVLFAEEKPSEVIFYEKLEFIDYGRIREVTSGPDGALYFSTSNRDGRGDAAENDDRIMRIIPESS
jgi:glucose/arabinose dehydrogenase